MLLALDPGMNRSGVALFNEHRRLVAAFRVDVDYREAQGLDPCHRARLMARRIVLKVHERGPLVAEWPRTYRAGKGAPSKGLFPLAGIVTAVAMMRTGVTTYEPRQWAKNVPKTKTGDGRESIRGMRIASRLTELFEADIWDELPRRGNHDIVDAIGIGLHHLGRY